MLKYQIFADSEEEAEAKLLSLSEKKGKAAVVCHSGETRNGRWCIIYYWER